MASKSSMTMTTIRSYSEMIYLQSFVARYEYCKLDGLVGKETFGVHRYLNQSLYTSKEWKSIRNHVILRDNGCDLGVEGYDIFGKVFIHHLNPITMDDIINRTPYLLDPEYLICVSKRTHDMIHYGNPGDAVYSEVVERSPYDTCPWRH